MHLTGRVTVSGPAGCFDERELPGAQATLLLAYLVLERSPVTRSVVADVLWHGSLPTGWATGLNALVSKLRALLQRGGVDRREI